MPNRIKKIRPSASRVRNLLTSTMSLIEENMGDDPKLVQNELWEDVKSNLENALKLTNLILETKYLKGSFYSVWEHGTVQTEGSLNTDTGEVTCNSVESEDLGSLEREYFEDKEGNDYEVCMTCHEYILKTVMNPDIVGKGLSEVKVCPNLNCDSRRE